MSVRLKGNILISLLAKAFFIKVAIAFIGLAVTSLISNELSTRDAGTYFYFLASAVMLSGLSRIGLDNFLLKNLDKSSDQYSVHLSASLIYMLFGFFAASVLFITTLGVARLEVYVIASGMSILSLLLVLRQVEGEAVKGMLLSILLPAVGLSTLLLLMMLVGALTLEMALVGAALVYVCLASIMIVGYRRYFLIPGWNMVLQVVKGAAPFMVISVTGLVSMNYPVLVLEETLGSEDVAYMTIIIKIASVNSFLLSAVNTVIAPRFSALVKGGEHNELALTAKRATRVLVLCSFPVYAVTVFFASDLLAFFGPQYDTPGLIVSLYAVAFAQLINGCTGSVSYLLQMSGSARIYAAMFSVFTVFAVATSYFVALGVGLIGFCFVYAGYIASLNVMSVLLVRYRLGYWVF